MGTRERRKSIGSLFGHKDRDNTLAAPRATSKGAGSSSVSVASSDGNDELRKSSDGAIDRFRSRQNSEDARSETSSHHRGRMSNIFKSRKKRRGYDADNLSQMYPDEAVPPLPAMRRPSTGLPYQSDESLGLAKSVASSLLTEDSDTEA